MENKELFDFEPTFIDVQFIEEPLHTIIEECSEDNKSSVDLEIINIEEL